jgi:hypothetical protein
MSDRWSTSTPATPATAPTSPGSSNDSRSRRGRRPFQVRAQPPPSCPTSGTSDGTTATYVNVRVRLHHDLVGCGRVQGGSNIGVPSRDAGQRPSRRSPDQSRRHQGELVLINTVTAGPSPVTGADRPRTTRQATCPAAPCRPTRPTRTGTRPPPHPRRPRPPRRSRCHAWPCGVRATQVHPGPASDHNEMHPDRLEPGAHPSQPAADRRRRRSNQGRDRPGARGRSPGRPAGPPQPRRPAAGAPWPAATRA